jgi:hypothetical protein
MAALDEKKKGDGRFLFDGASSGCHPETGTVFSRRSSKCPRIAK